MSEDEAAATLRRKLRRAERADDGPTAAPARVLRGELARSAEAALSLRLTVTDVADGPESRAELLAALPGRALLAVLAGPEGDCGVAVLDQSLSAAIVEVQTTGTVGRDAPTERRPTDTDAALAAPFLDHILAMIEQALADEATAGWCRGYRYESRASDARLLGFLLEETAYHSLTVTVGLGSGARTGALLLAMPAQSRRERRAAAAAAAREARTDAWSHRFVEAVRASEVRLDAVLTRVRLPLARVSALAPGEIVPLPVANLDGVRLEGSNGAAVGTGRLGQIRGHRAVRLRTLTENDSAAGSDETFQAARPPDAPGIEAPAPPDGAAGNTARAAPDMATATPFKAE